MKYLFHFHLSMELSDCFTIILSGFTLWFIWRTYRHQRKIHFDNMFQQYLLNYNNLITLINEKFEHSGDYQRGREIFGNAVGKLNEDQEKSFKEIYYKHINVFQHYFNFLCVTVNAIKNNRIRNKKIKIDYYRNFSSLLSFYELVFLAYWLIFFPIDKDLREIFLSHFLYVVKDYKIPEDGLMHKEAVKFIIDKLKTEK